MNNDKDKAKFTPGPWRMVMHDEDPAYIYTKKKYVAKINTKEQDEFCFSRAKAKANAQLIVAAPDMFEALEQALEAIIYYCNKLDIIYQDEEEFIKIEAALAKARGES